MNALLARVCFGSEVALAVFHLASSPPVVQHSLSLMEKDLLYAGAETLLGLIGTTILLLRDVSSESVE